MAPKMTMLEQRIYNLVAANNGKLNAEAIGAQLSITEHGKTKAKAVIGMTIGRMIKKGVPIEYTWNGYRVKQPKEAVNE